MSAKFHFWLERGLHVLDVVVQSGDSHYADQSGCCAAERNLFIEENRSIDYSKSATLPTFFFRNGADFGLLICHQLFSPSYRPEISNQLTCEYLIPDTGAQECDFPEDVGLPTEQGLGAIRLIGHVLQNKQTIGRLAAGCVNFCSRVTARVDSIDRPFIEWTYFFLFHFLLALMSSLWPPPPSSPIHVFPIAFPAYLSDIFQLCLAFPL